MGAPNCGSDSTAHPAAASTAASAANTTAVRTSLRKSLATIGILLVRMGCSHGGPKTISP
jgi:hypothetical protein